MRSANLQTRAGTTRLLPDFAQQDETFAGAFRLLRSAVAERVFPAAAVAVARSGKLVALKSFGHFTYAADSSEVRTDTVFDLASVTKVIATTAMSMVLYERGLLDLELPVVNLLPGFAGQLSDVLPESDPRRGQVTLRHLLAHSSGLPAYERLFLRAHGKEAGIAAALTTPLIAEPGSRAEYSDIGFIILGLALEKIAGESLATFCQREVFGPLGMSHTFFNPPPSWRSSIAPTVQEAGGVIQGEVQDENARVLGGIAGHAGAFSTAADVAVFANWMLQGGRPVLAPETVTLFTRRQIVPPGTSRALGWDTPSAPSQSGKYFSSHSFGHLGYTGTSLWIDPDRDLSITLLTNRTWPDCQNKAIQQVRPAFHDAVMEALEAKA